MSFPSNSQSSPAPAHIPRPCNDWILFRTDFCRLYQLRHDRDRSLNGTGLSGIASALWATYTPEEKKQWKDRAREASEMHAVAFPDYKYKPKRKGEKEAEVQSTKKPRGRKPKGKGKGDETEDLRKRTAGPSRDVRFVPYARPLTEDSGVVSEQAASVDFDLSGLPPFTGPFEVSPSPNDMVYTLPLAPPNAPMMFPQYPLQAAAPMQVSQPFTGWNSEPAQADMSFWSPTTYQGPYDFPDAASAPLPPALGFYSQVPYFDEHLNASPPQDDDFASIAPGVDVLDQFLLDHPGNFDITATQPVVDNTWDFVNFDGFGAV